MKHIIAFGRMLIFVFTITMGCSADKIQPTSEIQYLVFQLFTYNPDSNGHKQSLDVASLRNQINQILNAVDNNKGNGSTCQLGFAIGPLSLDHTDDELRSFIRESFVIADELNVAVAFHMMSRWFALIVPFSVQQIQEHRVDEL